MPPGRHRCRLRNAAYVVPTQHRLRRQRRTPTSTESPQRKALSVLVHARLLSHFGVAPPCASGLPASQTEVARYRRRATPARAHPPRVLRARALEPQWMRASRAQPSVMPHPQRLSSPNAPCSMPRRPLAQALQFPKKARRGGSCQRSGVSATPNASGPVFPTLGEFGCGGRHVDSEPKPV